MNPTYIDGLLAFGVPSLRNYAFETIKIKMHGPFIQVWMNNQVVF